MYRSRLRGDCIVEDYLHSDSNTTLSVTVTFIREKKALRSWLVQKPNRFKERLQEPWQVIKRNIYISSRHHDHCNKIETCRYITDAVNLAMLLLLLSGDVELNPGPGNFSYNLCVCVCVSSNCIEFASVVQFSEVKNGNYVLVRWCFLLQMQYFGTACC